MLSLNKEPTNDRLVSWQKCAFFSPSNPDQKTLFTAPLRYLSSRSQIPLREYGSTPAVGSSRTTTFEPPTNAIATDSFLCMPPDKWKISSLKRKLTEKQTCCFSCIKSQHTGVKLVTLPERFLVCSCRLCRRPTSSSKVSSSAFTSASDKPFIQP